MSDLGPIHHKRFLKKSDRRKVYRKIKDKLTEYGVPKDKIDEAIDLINQGKIKLNDTSLVRDIRTLSNIDKEIERLTKIIDESKVEKQIQA